ncbi:MAG TPA: hypothetical protein VFF73_29470 [Planctomycetota bacterium]|nr:hypothetical protein [Planctomycetota bacterium]
MRSPRVLGALLALALVAGAGCDEEKEAAGPLGPAARWLWSHQLQDGSWRSEKYAVLRTGQAYTPFVLWTLLEVPESVCPRPRGAVERAIAFIRSSVSAEGCLGKSDPDLIEYPNYATSYALRCLVRAGRPDDEPLIERMVRYLASQQFSEANGFEPGSRGYGGWGFGAARPTPTHPGHMDLAHTRRVLEALSVASVGSGAFARAEAFLAVLQRRPGTRQPRDPSVENPEGELAPDGGFYLSPVVLGANKGRHDPRTGGYRSYATATAEGILALLAAHVAATDERVLAARRWLEEHPSLDSPAGIPRDHPEPWYAALDFYHLAVRAEAQDALGMGGEWRGAIVERLESKARPDGSFLNDESGLMKEDDPILATSLAVLALRHAREASAKRPL